MLLPKWLSGLDDISQEIYQFIEKQIIKEQRPPSIGEIEKALKYPKSTVNHHLRKLEDARLIYCEPNKPCGIKLLKGLRNGNQLW